MDISEINAAGNLRDILLFADRKYHDVDFMCRKEGGKVDRRTFGDLRSSADAFSRLIDRRGLSGAHFAVIGTTRFEYISSYFGIVDSSSVIVPLSPKETTELNVKLMDFADTDVLIFSREYEELYRAVRSCLPRVKLFISFDGCFADEGVLDFSAITADDGDIYDADIDPRRLSTIIFTSGTTSFPKGVMLCQGGITFNAISGFEPNPIFDSRILSFLPVHHCYCFVSDIVKNLIGGNTVYINDNIMNTFANLRSVRPHRIYVVPALAGMIMGGALKYAADHPEMSEQAAVKEFTGGSLDMIICGGAPLDKDLNERWNSTGIFVRNGYGISEYSPTISVNSPQNYRGGSVGRPLRGTLARERDGEIQVKGPCMMLGYYKNEAATKEAITPDGWLRTGDSGYIDEDGYIFITGRIKNLILLSNGENVSAEAIEGHFAGEKAIKQLVVYQDGEHICAEIWPDMKALPADPEEMEKALIRLVMRVNRTLSIHQKISAIRVRSCPFETTASLKIKRASCDRTLPALTLS